MVHAQIKVNQVMKLTSVFMYSFLMSIFVLSFCKSCCPTFLYEPSTNNVHSYGQILLQWNLMHSRLEILRSIKESILRTQIFLRWYWLFNKDFLEIFGRDHYSISYIKLDKQYSFQIFGSCQKIIGTSDKMIYHNQFLISTKWDDTKK